MYSSFFGLEVAKKALFAQRYSMEVTGHNISNADTPGFSRQRAVLESAYPQDWGFDRPMVPGQVGMGVNVQEVRRLRDIFADGQFRNENKFLGEWEKKSKALSQLETIFNEPNAGSVTNTMDAFWAALNELAKNPESPTVRSLVRENAITFVNTINTINKKINQTRVDANDNMAVLVNEVNSLAKQIADLNAQIKKVEVGVDNANDLRDHRDLLVDQLSKMVNVEEYEDLNGNYTVKVGGVNLVKGIDYEQLEFNHVSFDPYDKDASGAYTAGPTINWVGLNQELSLSSGQLKGLMDIRDDIGPHYMQELDRMVGNFVEEFNKIHNSDKRTDGGESYTFDEDKNLVRVDWDFFDVGEVSKGELIKLNDKILEDPGNIATALKPSGGDDPAPGDYDVAQELATLRQAKNIDGGTYEEFVNALVTGDLAVKSKEAQKILETESHMVAYLDSTRKAVSGVSFDEEVVTMLKLSHGFNAASRMVTTIDEMLDVIVNRLGIVGR